MQITHYTARKRIGFKLPSDAFEALTLVEDRRSPLFQDITTLRLNLSRIEDVAGSHMGLSKTDTVFVDFETDDREQIASLNSAAALIEAHARAALAVHRFLPGALEHAYQSFPQYEIDGSLISTYGKVPAGRVVHVDDQFAVIANARPGSASIHYMRDGKPAWTEAADLGAIAHEFWPALTDSTVNLDGPPVPPTSDLDSVTEWAMSQAYIPALEHAGPVDITDHKLRQWITYAKVVYADPDIIITGDRARMTAHFEDEDQYGCTMFERDGHKTLWDALQTPGLACIDPLNPVRMIVDEAIAARRHYLATRDLPSAASINPRIRSNNC